MDSFGEMMRKLRKSRKQPLRTVATFLDIDQAILSKIERGLRRATRQHAVKLAAYFKVAENDLLLPWLAEKLIDETGEEEFALKALQLAEEQVAYAVFKKIDKNQVLKHLKAGIKKFNSIEKAWIYGSFARGDDGPKSDVDIALQTSDTFTYFDLAAVQHQLENKINRKVDVGFIDSFKPYILAHVKADLKLIYQRRP